MKKNEIDDRKIDEMIFQELESVQEGRPKSSRTKSGRKVPGKYLTKDKGAMKGEIERVSKLRDDDPKAYGKWVADYKARNTKTGKPHKTKKSAATIAYEKKFGNKKESKMINENERNKEIATEIINQIGGFGRLNAMTGAYNFVAIDNGVSFKIKNPKANYIKIVLNSMDLYDVEVGRIRGMNYTVVKNASGLFFDQLKGFIEKATGMYLSLNEMNESRSSNRSTDILQEKTDAMIKNKAKASGISASILRQVYSRGAAAWKSGHRPGVSQQQWAAGRVNSFITGKGGARKADSDLWAKAKKSKKRKSESLEYDESAIRRRIRSIIMEIHDEGQLGKSQDLEGVDVMGILPYSDLLLALAKNFGWEHELPNKVAYAVEIKDPEKREQQIKRILQDYDVYDDYFHFLGLNESDGLDELYPLIVGEDN